MKLRSGPAPLPPSSWPAQSANVRPELAKLLMNTNPHPLPEFRANGAPSNLPAFAAAFSCKTGDPKVRADLFRIW